MTKPLHQLNFKIIIQQSPNSISIITKIKRKLSHKTSIQNRSVKREKNLTESRLSWKENFVVRRTMSYTDVDHLSIDVIIVTCFASLYEHTAGTHLPFDVVLRRRDSGEMRCAIHGKLQWFQNATNRCVLMNDEREEENHTMVVPLIIPHLLPLLFHFTSSLFHFFLFFFVIFFLHSSKILKISFFFIFV